MDTVFYIAGGVLVLIALIVSAIGLRSESFPSDGVLRIGVLLIVLVVGFTSYAAVEASQEEALHRETEENELAAEEADEAAAEEEAEGVSGSSDVDAVDEAAGEEKAASEGETVAGASLVEDGAVVFADNGCGGCHTLADNPDAVGDIGPNLDAQLVDQDAAYIETAIVDPSADLVEGFGDLMPKTYAEDLSPEDLDALVVYLDEVTSESGGAK